MATASLKFTQGSTTDIAGRALLVSASGGQVVATNGDDTGIVKWKYELLHVPPGSSIPLTTVITASATYPQPDKPGSYRVRLTVEDAAGNVDVDIRNFCVIAETGYIAPPFQGDPPPISLQLKPNEMNIGGQPNGWMGDDNPSRPMMYQLITQLHLGPQGSQGAMGGTGSQGFQGTPGPQGTTGSTGVQGSQGSQGSRGLQGYQGTIGSTGNQGNQGYQGTTGSTGSQGNQGSIGLQGSQGYQGTTGSTGSQGNQGNQGNQGEQGSLAPGGANTVFWSSGTANSFTANPIVTSVTTNSILFPATVSPSISQTNSGTVGGTGATTIISSQGNATAGSTGGDLTLRAGPGVAANGSVKILCGSTTVLTAATTLASFNVPINTNGTLTTGGNITIGGTVLAPPVIAVDNTAGQNLTVRSQNNTGLNSTGGNLALQSGTGTAANGDVLFFAGATQVSKFATVAITNYVPTLQFDSGVSSPVFQQATNATNGATGQAFTVQAQSCTGTDSVGGSLYLRGGNGTVANGDVIVPSGLDVQSLMWIENQAIVGGLLTCITVNGLVQWQSISTLELVKIGGDIGGSSTTPTVISISGNGGTVPITATIAQFASTIVYPTITQATTSNAAYDMRVVAQSSTGNSSAPANLILDAGTNQSGVAKGVILFGYAGGTDGAYGTIGPTSATFVGNLSNGGILYCYGTAPAESHVISRNAGFSVGEDILWFQETSMSTANVNFDITSWLGSAGIPNDHTYHGTYTICADGLPNVTITAVATWTKFGGTLIAREGVTGVNSAAIAVGASNPTNDTLRFSVTPPSSTTTIWTCKVQIIQT